jgi:hypothetical protein
MRKKAWVVWKGSVKDADGIGHKVKKDQIGSTHFSGDR